MKSFKITLKLNNEASPHLYIRRINELIAEDEYLHPMLKGLLLTLKKAHMPFVRLSLEKEIEILDSQNIIHEIRHNNDLDEATSCYKNIQDVIALQVDLIKILVTIMFRFIRPVLRDPDILGLFWS